MMDERKNNVAQMEYDTLIAEGADRLRFQFEFAQSGIRGLTLANGGALIALFTLIGALGKDGALSYDPRAMWWSFGWFVLGLACSLCATIAAFLCQMWFYYSTRMETWNLQHRMTGEDELEDPSVPYWKGQITFIGGLVVMAIGTACFVIGSAVALSGVI